MRNKLNAYVSSALCKLIYIFGIVGFLLEMVLWYAACIVVQIQRGDWQFMTILLAYLHRPTTTI